MAPSRDNKKSAAERLPLQLSELQIKYLFAGSAEWYWEQDDQYRFTHFIGKALERAGFSSQSLIGTVFWDAGNVPLTDDRRWDAFKAVLAARQPFTDFVYQHVNAQGELQYLCVGGDPSFDEQGQFTGYCGTGKDVTQRVEIERRLAIDNAITHILIESSGISEAAPNIIHQICAQLGWACGVRWDIDVKGRRLHCAQTWANTSAAIETFLESMTREVWIPLAPPSAGEPDLTQNETAWARDLAQSPSFPCAVAALAVGLSGAFSFPILVEGEVVGVFAFFSNEIYRPDARLINCVTYLGSQIGRFWQRTLAEERLREVAHRLQYLVEHSNDWQWEQDEHYRFTRITGNNLDKFGLGLNEAIGKTHWQLPFSYASEEQWTQLRAALDARRPFSHLVLICRSSDGALCYVSLSGDPIFDELGRFKGYRGIGKDITERERDVRIRRLVDDIRIGVLFYEDLSGVITDANDAFLKIVGYTREDLNAGKVDWLKMTPPEGHAASNRATVDLQTTGTTPLYEKEYIRKNGSRVPVLIGSTMWDAGASKEKGASFIIDLSERTKVEERVLRESEARFRSLTELSSDWYWEQDEQFRFTFLSGAVEQKTGVAANSYIGRTLWDFPALNLTQDDWSRHRARLAKHEPFYDFEMRFPDIQDRQCWVSISGRPIFDIYGSLKGYRGIGRDITERKIANERIEYLASHDGLTGLPNRAMFSEMLNLAIHSARRYNRYFALLFIDLDRFKNINDTFGHEAGDTLLKEMGTRLEHTLRASDVVARLGGDEFVVLIQEVTDDKHVATVARKILSALIKPIVLLGQECRVTASIGVCLFPQDAQDEQTLMKKADIAMYRAKEEGKNNYKFYSEQLNVHTLERLALETSLRRAIERDEFFLHYQAKLNLKSGEITGVEALLRWQHPELGMIAPAQFIPLAEETGLIVPLGKWVLRTACAQNVEWQRQGLPPLCMAVNISPRQFADDELVSDVAGTLERTGMAPTLLELEITESMVMQNSDRALKVLSAIKQLGVRLAIDDFGTGYSSLAQIKRFPIDTLKVDRSFIREIPQDAEDKAITEAIIAMGKTLSLTVVAEGVETSEQQTFLRDHACDEMQGYYFSKPIPAELFAELVRRHASPPAK